MIFSKQRMQTAYEYAGQYFDKILLINFVENSWSPIKVDNDEWNKLDHHINFTDWVESFMNSTMYQPVINSLTPFDVLKDLEYLKTITTPLIFHYKKKINNDYHIVQTEVYPIGSGLGYLFVRDVTKMMS